LKIGFRNYDERGNKQDNVNRQFFGWSENFDETIPNYSSRI